MSAPDDPLLFVYRAAPLTMRALPAMAQVWHPLFEDEAMRNIIGEALPAESWPHLGHQMFGMPRSLQGDPRFRAADEWNKTLETPQASATGLSFERDRTEWNNWELLLQLSGDDHAGMVWGDAGSISFLIRRADLEARRFERCYFEFECG